MALDFFIHGIQKEVLQNNLANFPKPELLSQPLISAHNIEQIEIYFYKHKDWRSWQTQEHLGFAEIINHRGDENLHLRTFANYILENEYGSNHFLNKEKLSQLLDKCILLCQVITNEISEESQPEFNSFAKRNEIDHTFSYLPFQLWKSKVNSSPFDLFYWEFT